jgi:hypothetical protein
MMGQARATSISSTWLILCKQAGILPDHMPFSFENFLTSALSRLQWS